MIPSDTYLDMPETAASKVDINEFIICGIAG
jgi:hypothetical protein